MSQPTARRRATPPPRRPSRTPTRRPRRKAPGPGAIWLRRLLALSGLIVAAVVVWFLVELFQPFHGGGHGSVEVTIPHDAGAGEIGTILARDGVVDSAFFFKLRTALAGDHGQIVDGPHRMQLGMSYAGALKLLTTAPAAPPTSDVTITPGRSRRQLDALLRSQGIKGSYLAATRHSALLKPTAYGAPKSTATLEGFLWPDTYQLRKPVQLRALVDDQLTQFKQEFGKVDFSYAAARHLSRYDVLIIASLITGESMLKRDGPLTASVIYNRLRLGMDLGLDSTVEYATGNYGTLTEKDLSSPSPWNTRNHPGLPPTPISSPGMAAIQAAAHPARTDYLYFINEVCGGGKLLFTASYPQFLNWSAKWQQATAQAAKHHRSAQFCKGGRP